MWRLRTMGNDRNGTVRRLGLILAVALPALLLAGVQRAKGREQGKEPPSYACVNAELLDGTTWCTGLRFDVQELWRYDDSSQTWEQVKLGRSRGIAVQHTDDDRDARLLLDLSAVIPADEVGLYYLKWSLGRCPGDTLIYAGKFVPNDLMIGEPPAGMIVTGVPIKEGPKGTFAAKAAFVPDPRTHCVAKRNTTQLIDR
jgi:hypothetical protein